ncbi:N-acetylmuramoyl-L-alanine amidase [Promicromonospora panici]|uniref:N-acetylmuramoyl-L-alanine amidase n=1 Tax=Promicromonospora panici TaxID=2219658 RepID=UPI00101D7A66|nr:N-acetylmuramoyl-L-alanine amidase [Promicromonospora panici]
MRPLVRRTTTASLVLALAIGGVLLPAVELPLPEAAAVPPEVGVVPVAGIDATARRDPTALGRAEGHAVPHAQDHADGPAAPGRLAALSGRAETLEFLVAGVTWDAGTAEEVTEVALRVREDRGWGGWQSVGVENIGSDGGAATDGRAGTEPFLSTGADAVQVRVRTLSGRAPSGLRVDVVDPGVAAADRSATRPPSSATAATGDEIRPALVPRSGWGADESLGSMWPEVSGRLDALYVHHTAGTNSYSRSQSAAIVRGIHAYHTKSRGWPDIGYQFLVDRYGTVFVGRREAATDNPIGAQAGGFNTGTIGVSAMGNFETTGPTASMLRSLERVLAWKAYRYHVPVTGSVSLPNGGSPDSNTRSSPGGVVRVPRILGHRTTHWTACPGERLQSRLPAIRRTVKAMKDAALDRYGTVRYPTGEIQPHAATANQYPIQWPARTRFSWDPEPGAVRYQVLERYAGYGSPMPNERYWRRIITVSGTSANLYAAEGLSVQYAIRAVDSAGRLGPVSHLVRTSRPVPFTAMARTTGTWARVSDGDYFRDRAWSTIHADSRLVVSGVERVTQVRVMVATAPGRGRVAVYVGSTRVGVINTDAPSDAQRVLTVRLPEAMSGRVTLRTLDEARVRVSGVAFVRW